MATQKKKAKLKAAKGGQKLTGGRKNKAQWRERQIAKVRPVVKPIELKYRSVHPLLSKTESILLGPENEFIVPTRGVSKPSFAQILGVYKHTGTDRRDHVHRTRDNSVRYEKPTIKRQRIRIEAKTRRKRIMYGLQFAKILASKARGYSGKI